LRNGIFRQGRDVDGITQAALGAAIGELMMGRRLGNRALAWGALFGVLPELLEFLVSPLLDTARELAVERGLGHSPVVMALASWGIARGLARWWSREKLSVAEVWRFVFTVWCVHVLADCLTSEGAALSWPVSTARVALNVLPRTDFLIIVPLLVAVFRLAFLQEEKVKKSRSKKAVPLTKRRKICFWGLGLVAGYALIAVGMKFAASAGFTADLARRGTKFERRIEAPTPYNILLWRCVVDRGDALWVGYRTVYEFHETPVRWTIYPRGGDWLSEVRDTREAKTLMAVSNGWWLARPHAKGAWLGDLRFQEARVWGSRKGMVDSRLPRSWVIDPQAKSDPLRPISPYTENRTDFLKRLGGRVIGRRADWEANPRLAGVAGSLPEFLAVEE
jgi:inner membrane protein